MNGEEEGHVWASEFEDEPTEGVVDDRIPTYHPVGDLPAGTRFRGAGCGAAEFVVVKQLEDYARVRRAGRSPVPSKLISSYVMVRPLSDFARSPTD